MRVLKLVSLVLVFSASLLLGEGQGTNGGNHLPEPCIITQQTGGTPPTCTITVECPEPNQDRDGTYTCEDCEGFIDNKIPVAELVSPIAPPTGHGCTAT
jgi:hypothetical protein